MSLVGSGLLLLAGGVACADTAWKHPLVEEGNNSPLVEVILVCLP